MFLVSGLLLLEITRYISTKDNITVSVQGVISMQLKIPKFVLPVLAAFFLIQLVSASAQYDPSNGIVVSGSGNNLSSICENIGMDPIFSYDPSTQTVIINSNIFIDENSELVINNQTLIFNCSSDGQYRLETNFNGTHEMGGNSTLIVMNHSSLTASNSNYEFYMAIRNNSAFTLRDSELTECGFDSTHPGLNITAKYANVTGSVIRDVYVGIYLNHADNCSISGNHISAGLRGIEMYNVNYSSISGNNITSELSEGLYLDNANHCNILGNFVYTPSSGDHGIYMGHSDYCNISGNNISSDDVGIYLYWSDNAALSNSRVTSSNDKGVYLVNSSGFKAISSHLEGTVRDLKLEPAENVSLINTSCDDIEIIYANSYLRRYWYLDVYVNDSAGNPITGANVTCRMSNGTRAFTALTASTGYISRQTVEQYYQNYTDTIYYTPHTVNASKGNYLPENKTVYLDESRFVTIELNTPPNVTLVSVDGMTSSNFVINNKTPEIKFKFIDPEQTNAYCKIQLYSPDKEVTHTHGSYIVQNDTIWNVTLISPIFEGNWSVHVDCNDSTELGVSENWTFYMNKLPEVELLSPANSSATLGGVTNFTYVVLDNESSLNCSFYNNFTGSWDENGTQTISGDLTGTFTQNLTEGLYVWNVKCYDGFQSAFAPFNYTLLVDPTVPDLSISEANITFYPSNPYDGDVVEITVAVYNNGNENVTSAVVKFGYNSQSQENNLSVAENSVNYTKFHWTATEGDNDLTFMVDPEDDIQESNESNNNVTVSVHVNAATQVIPDNGGRDRGGVPPYSATPLPSCFDGILNQDETGIDCGGPCDPCMSCSDGIHNQGEEEIDCGGPCPPCSDENVGNDTQEIATSTETAQKDVPAGPDSEKGYNGSIGSGGPGMVTPAKPGGNTTQTSSTIAQTSESISAQVLLERIGAIVGETQKQIVSFISGVYEVASGNIVGSSISVLLMIGLLYLYYSRVRSPILEEETKYVKSEVEDGKK
jgi:parallel beta-helix repeat protein